MFPTAGEGVEGMQIAKLALIIAAPINKNLVLVHGQSKTVPCLWQVAVVPLLPLACLETVGVHGLNGRGSTAVGLFSSGPKKA